MPTLQYDVMVKKEICNMLVNVFIKAIVEYITNTNPSLKTQIILLTSDSNLGCAADDGPHALQSGQTLVGSFIRSVMTRVHHILH